MLDIKNFLKILYPLLIALAFSPFVFFSENKSLQYSVDKNIIKNNDIWPQIEMRYQGESINNGTLIKITIINNGSIPVKREDFELPLSFDLDKEGKLLSYMVVNTSPDNIALRMKLIDKSIQVEPLLMNPSDEFTIELFGQGNLDIKPIKFRIAGIKDIVNSKYQASLALSHIDIDKDNVQKNSILIRLHPIFFPIFLFVISLILIIAFETIAMFFRGLQFKKSRIILLIPYTLIMWIPLYLLLNSLRVYPYLLSLIIFILVFICSLLSEKLVNSILLKPLNDMAIRNLEPIRKLTD